MYTINNQVTPFELSDGITSKVLAHNDSLMIVENEFLQGATAPTHNHTNEQAGYVLSGEFKFTIDGEDKILQAGDSFIVGKNISHSCIAVKQGVILDIFTPLRKDILIKSQSSK